MSLIFALCISKSTCELEISLDTLCQDKALKLESISQVKQLIEESKVTELAQCNKYKNSLIELEPILNIVESGQTCNLNLVDKIRKYQYRFITKVDNHESFLETQDSLPQALQKFFFALGFQINAECKILMINNFENDLEGKIRGEDYDGFRLLDKADANLLDDSLPISDYDDVVLLSDFEVLGTPTGQGNKLLIKVQTNGIFNKLKKLCKNKFKPIYDKLIMPLVELSNLGYNYKGELLERELAELRSNTLIRRWYKILQTCESFESVEIYEDPDMSLDGKQVITLIGKDEASKLKSNSNEVEETEKPLEYEPAPAHNSDKLWILERQEIEQLISRYQSNASEASRIRTRLIKKLFNRVKDALKKDKLAVKSNIGEGKNLDPSKIMSNMISLMDDVVESENEQNSLDTPVAFRGRQRVPRYPPPAPPRTCRIPRKMNGTKLTTWFWDSTVGTFVPSRWTIIGWLGAFCGLILMLLSLCSLMG